MINKKAESPFWQLLAHKHLFNPLYTMWKGFADKEKIGVNDSPVGKLRLAKDNLTNVALWNAIYSSTLLGGGALLASLLANRYHENKVYKDMSKGLKSRMEASKPRLVSDPDLSDVSAYSMLPDTETKEMRKLLEKSSSVDKKAEEEGFIESALGNAVANIIPMAATGLGIFGGIWAGNELSKSRIKNKIKDNLVRIRNAQAFVDRNILIEQGLINPDAPGDGVVTDKKKLNKKASIFTALAAIHPTLWLLGGLGLGGVAASLMETRDKNKATVNALRRLYLGKNELQGAPQLSLLSIPAKASELIKTPGDKKKETYSDLDDQAIQEMAAKLLTAKNPKLLPEVIDVSSVETVADPETVKKDALFR